MKRPWRTHLAPPIGTVPFRCDAPARSTAARGIRRAARSVGIGVACTVMAVGLAGCAAARSELGTVNSDCYIVLPTAFRAVHHHGKLDGVRLVPVTSLRSHARLLYDAATRSGKRTGDVCLVAFRGDYLATSVVGHVGRTAGHVAVVELGYPGKRLFATLLLRRPPISFGHFRI